MEISTNKARGVTVVKLVGTMYADNGRELARELDRLINEGEFLLVLDGSELTYIESSGMRALLAARKAVKRGNRGDVRLAALQPFVRSTLELVGFTRIFDIFDSVEEAVVSFAGLPAPVDSETAV